MSYTLTVLDDLQVQGELPERPSTNQHSDSDKTLVAATGAVTKQLCSGHRLCSWLGLKADTIEGPQVGQMCAEQHLDMAQSARLAAEVAEVCIEAVMQPTQVCNPLATQYVGLAFCVRYLSVWAGIVR